MGKSTSGPDETDVIGMMMAIGSLHSGHVELNVRQDGIGFSPSVVTSCQMHFNVLPGSSLPEIVGVEGKWPCPEHQTLWAHLYDGLYKLDFAISQVYQNEKLWVE
jgi:hypothetical protein